MSLQQMALLAGLFIVPGTLLSIGHRLRRRSPRLQSAFWGAIAAHILASLAVLWFSMIPAEGWQSTDMLRGAIGFWSLLIAPVVGGALGAMRAK